ncbi:ABC transporter substrate-binding protein [Arthrobacter sp. FW306-05-C]|uniref:ABC transporter substrate-binding protein n=1 Tax=Arthrobacter sp. FW306-05-C TaxID=2879620 RepID=UPI001F42D3C7|nr:ABC transporter substrate-binding protein [Arthrobacter sp. FW306-05-C]UKA65147.1 ABC transporter substrate-binding protein [Arthrobacter sp. FW306-05-C]
MDNISSSLSSPAGPDKTKPSFMRGRKVTGLIAAAGAIGLALSGCGSSAAPSAGPSAPVVDPASAKAASGSLSICGGRDSVGLYQGTVDAFMKANPGITAKYTVLGATTDESRTQAVQRLQAKSSECDLYLTDVTWTPEFASQGWLQDMTKVTDAVKDTLIPSTVATTQYKGKSWATPFYTNAGLIYYAKDKVAKPETWQQLYAEAAKSPGNGLVYQGKQYEGLTVNFLELLYSAGGDVIDDQGNIKVDSPQTRKVLDFMAQGIKNGSADRAVLTYEENASRLAYESGKFGYERNWPNVYGQLNATPLKGTFGVAPLPSFDGSTNGSGVLGGWNLAISAYASNPAAAVAFVNFESSPEWQKHVAMDYSQAPAGEAAYSDLGVLGKMPFAKELLVSVKGAKPRPVSPVYSQISAAINKNVYAVLSGASSTEDAVKNMADQIKTAQASF